MKCEEFENLYHDMLDGTLPPARQQALREHRQQCHACAQKYDASLAVARALQDIDVPPVRENFAADVIAAATAGNTRPSARGKWMLSAALAASVVLAIWVTVLLNSKPGMQDSVMMLSSTDAQLVRISIESGKDIANATIAIDLTDNLEIDGHSNSTSLQWETTLRKGTNIINLPILPTANGDGLITTRILLGGEEKSIRIKTRSDLFNEVWHRPTYYLST